MPFPRLFLGVLALSLGFFCYFFSSLLRVDGGGSGGLAFFTLGIRSTQFTNNKWLSQSDLLLRSLTDHFDEFLALFTFSGFITTSAQMFLELGEGHILLAEIAISRSQ